MGSSDQNSGVPPFSFIGGQTSLGMIFTRVGQGTIVLYPSIGTTWHFWNTPITGPGGPKGALSEFWPTGLFRFFQSAPGGITRVIHDAVPRGAVDLATGRALGYTTTQQINRIVNGPAGDAASILHESGSRSIPIRALN